MLDNLDRQILDALRTDAREPTAALARRLDVSRSTIQHRIKRLEEQGIIESYTIRLADEFSRRMIRAHVLISVSPKHAARVSSGIKPMMEVRALHAISGAFDMIAEVAAETMDALDTITDRIGSITGVERTQTLILMSTRFSR